MTLWWSPVGLVWAVGGRSQDRSKHGARCRTATFPRIVLDKDVGGEVQGPGEGQEDKEIQPGQFFNRATHSGKRNADRADRNKADLRVVFALIKRGNRLCIGGPVYDDEAVGFELPEARSPHTTQSSTLV